MAQRLNLPPIGPVCEKNKKRHYSEETAKYHMQNLERSEQEKGSSKPGVLNTYWCELCQTYHLGKQCEMQ